VYQKSEQELLLHRIDGADERIISNELQLIQNGKAILVSCDYLLPGMIRNRGVAKRIVFNASAGLASVNLLYSFRNPTEKEYAVVSYQDDFNMINLFEVKSWVLIYSIVAFFVTNSILHKSGEASWQLWFICPIYDVLAYFVSFFFMVVYNNFRIDPNAFALVTSTDSIFVLALLQIAKRVLLRWYLGFRFSKTNDGLRSTSSLK
jgi:hypothetical protein